MYHWWEASVFMRVMAVSQYTAVLRVLKQALAVVASECSFGRVSRPEKPSQARPGDAVSHVTEPIRAFGLVLVS